MKARELEVLQERRTKGLVRAPRAVSAHEIAPQPPEVGTSAT